MLKSLFKIQYILYIVLISHPVYAAIQPVDDNIRVKIILTDESSMECSIALTDANDVLITDGVNDLGEEGMLCDSDSTYLPSVLYDKSSVTESGYFCFQTPNSLYGWGRHDCNEILEAYYEDSGDPIEIPLHEAPEFEALPVFNAVVGEEVLFNAKATSVGGYQILYSTQNAPVGHQFNQRTGEFSWIAEYEGQFDFQIIAQEIYADANQTATLPVTIIVDDYTLADFGIDPERIETFTANDIAALTPESMIAFRSNDIKDISPASLVGLNAQQLGAMTPSALNAISPIQFQYIPIDSFVGLNASNLAGFNTTVIKDFTLAHLQAINSASFKNLSDQNVAKMLTNLPADLLTDSRLNLNELLPETWEVNERTGELNHPKGIPLSLRGLDLGEQRAVIEGKLAYYGGLPDFNSNVSLGGEGNIPTLLDDINRTLNQLGFPDIRFTQNADGLLTNSGDTNVSLMPNIDSIAQTHEQEQVTISDSQGTVKIVTANQYHFEFIPSPQNTTAVIDALGTDGQTTIGKGGDIVLSYTPTTTTRAFQTQVHLVAVFDGFVSPAPSQFCIDPNCNQFNTGVFFNQTNLRHIRADTLLPETGRMVYEDGTSQVIYPSVVAPHFFITGLQQIEGIQSVTAQNSGRQYQVTLDSGITASVFPSFNAEVTDLAKGQHLTPSFDYDPETQILTYTVAVKAQVFTQKLQVR